VRNPDGTESRIAVIGEPFGEVSPGFLPRTLDQLREGRHNDESRAENRFRRRRLSSEEAREEPVEPQQTIEEALDSLLGEISDDDDTTSAIRQVQSSDMPREPTGLSRPLSRTEVRLQRARDRIVRVFGSREDVQRDDYESPISTMYNRAFDRYRQAEARRESGDRTAPPREGLSEQERRDIDNQILWGILNDSRTSLLRTASNESRASLPAVAHTEDVASTTPAPAPATDQVRHDPTTESVSPTVSPPESSRVQPNFSVLVTRNNPNATGANIESIRRQTENYMALRRAARVRPIPVTPPPATLDEPDRPPPLKDEEMTKTLACQVCYSQLADIAVLPCGHMVMCEWCADLVVPVKHGHVPSNPTKCPMCRKGIKQRVKIHMG
jgi:hypothetical protein